MSFYFAPLEGITGYVYRNVHKKLFPGVDKYFSPFINATQSENFRSREINDILPENNKGLSLVPQLLTNRSKDFISSSKFIKQLGYDEVNLNLGCPSGTVVSKFRGAGFLAKKEELSEFMNDIFEEQVIGISVKTRIGIERPEEFYELIEIYNKYPIQELIIHPRVQKDFYNNKPNLKVFADALAASKNPVCYNGDINTAEDYLKFTRSFPCVENVMIGRGLITNPGLISKITSGANLDQMLLRTFLNELVEAYCEVLSGDKNVLFKMKELWQYIIVLFPDSDKYAKRIRKAEKLIDYQESVNSLFRDIHIVEQRESTFWMS